MKKDYEAFLKELTELSKKYGIYIDGCGCCGSPNLREDEPEYKEGLLCWDSEDKEYEFWGDIDV